MSWGAHLEKRRISLAIVGLGAIAAALAPLRPSGDRPGDAGAALARRAGIRVDATTFSWVRPDDVERTSPFDWHAAVFLGRRDGEKLRDIYTAELSVTADGLPREMRRLTDLSRTADGDESDIAISGRGPVAFASRVDGAINSISVVDFRGEPPSLTADWPFGWRLANRITNLQRTGRADGVAWRTFVFRTPPAAIALAFDGGETLSVRADRQPGFTIGRDGIATTQDVIVQETLKGKPAFLAWAVDTARESPWIGPRNIEWLEKFWFDLNDWLARKQYAILGEGGNAAAEYASMSASKPSVGLIGWPPAPIAPVLSKPETGEGRWVAVQDELFTPAVSGPPLFYRTFVRTDAERPFAATHVITWDPSRVELRMMAGVREPVSTTGLKGLGEVPREGERGGEIERLVGAFNGAFQAVHGEWGMALDRRYYLRPRPYGATVATYDDGRTAMGTWPDPVGEMPAGMRDMRQNVHPLVENGAFNPYKRDWWGGVPAGIEERVVTTRSGICLTFGGKLMYFWGDHLSPESLGAAMIAARCDYGIHLDMNSGHCGFELYRVDPVDGQPRAQRALSDSSEAEGIVPRRPDLAFRAKKLVRQMAHMRFPRYIARDPRDFFYLLLRPSVFDRPPDGAADAAWKPLGAREGAPVPAVSAGMGGGRTVYKFDPAQISIEIADGAPESALFSVPFATRAAGVAVGLRRRGVEDSPMQRGESGLAITADGMAWRAAGDTGGDTLVQGLSMNAAKLVRSSCALGIDAGGYLLAATSEKGAGDLDSLLRAAGVGETMALIAPQDVADGANDVHWLIVTSREKPSAFRIFEDVRPVPPSVWREVYRRQGSALGKSDGEE
jgi:hypothetical protein